MINKTAHKPFIALRRVALLALAAAGLAGCVYYPSGYGYGSGYYAAAPVVVQPAPVVVGGWWGWGGGGHGHWH